MCVCLVPWLVLMNLTNGSKSGKTRALGALGMGESQGGAEAASGADEWTARWSSERVAHYFERFVQIRAILLVGT
jgi:hypothetical protein